MTIPQKHSASPSSDGVHAIYLTEKQRQQYAEKKESYFKKRFDKVNDGPRQALIDFYRGNHLGEGPAQVTISRSNKEIESKIDAYAGNKKIIAKKLKARGMQTLASDLIEIAMNNIRYENQSLGFLRPLTALRHYKFNGEFYFIIVAFFYAANTVPPDEKVANTVPDEKENEEENYYNLLEFRGNQFVIQPPGHESNFTIQEKDTRILYPLLEEIINTPDWHHNVNPAKLVTQLQEKIKESLPYKPIAAACEWIKIIPKGNRLKFNELALYLQTYAKELTINDELVQEQFEELKHVAFPISSSHEQAKQRVKEIMSEYDSSSDTRSESDSKSETESETESESSSGPRSAPDLELNPTFNLWWQDPRTLAAFLQHLNDSKDNVGPQIYEVLKMLPTSVKTPIFKSFEPLRLLNEFDQSPPPSKKKIMELIKNDDHNNIPSLFANYQVVTEAIISFLKEEGDQQATQKTLSAFLPKLFKKEASNQRILTAILKESYECTKTDEEIYDLLSDNEAFAFHYLQHCDQCNTTELANHINHSAKKQYLVQQNKWWPRFKRWFAINFFCKFFGNVQKKAALAIREQINILKKTDEVVPDKEFYSDESTGWKGVLHRLFSEGFNEIEIQEPDKISLRTAEGNKLQSNKEYTDLPPPTPSLKFWPKPGEQRDTLQKFISAIIKQLNS